MGPLAHPAALDFVVLRLAVVFFLGPGMFAAPARIASGIRDGDRARAPTRHRYMRFAGFVAKNIPSSP